MPKFTTDQLDTMEQKPSGRFTTEELDNMEFESFDTDTQQKIKDTVFNSALSDSDPNDVFDYVDQIKEEGKGSRWEDWNNRFASGLSRVGTAIADLGATQGQFYIPTSVGPGLISPKLQQKNQEITSDMVKELKSSGDFLWRVSNNPGLALQNDDLFAKATDMVAQTLPYITATTAAGVMLGPAGAFGVGSLLEGDVTYRNAKDNGVEENKALMLGIGGGLIKGTIEAVGFKGVEGLFERASEKFASKILRGGAKFTAATVVEALEEGSQELVDIGAEKTYRNVDWNEGLTRTLGAMAGGAFLGGAIKGGGMAVRQALLTANEPIPKLESEQTKTTDVGEPPVPPVSGSVDFANRQNLPEATTPPVEAQTPSGAVESTPISPEEIVGKIKHLFPNIDDVQIKVTNKEELNIVGKTITIPKSILDDKVQLVRSIAHEMAHRELILRPEGDSGMNPQSVEEYANSLMDEAEKIVLKNVSNKAVPPTPSSQGKEAWEMTKKEFDNNIDQMKDILYHGTDTVSAKNIEEKGFKIWPETDIARMGTFNTPYGKRPSEFIGVMFLAKGNLKDIQDLYVTSPTKGGEGTIIRAKPKEGISEALFPENKKQIEVLNEKFKPYLEQIKKQYPDDPGIVAALYRRRVEEHLKKSGFSGWKYGKNLGFDVEPYEIGIFFPDDIEILSHRKAVQQALSEGKPVPRNILEEYKGESWADEALAKTVVKENLTVPPNQEPRLEGGREAGGTTIVSDVAAEIATLAKKAYHNPVQMISDIKDIIKRNMKAGVNHIKTLGSSGKRIIKDIEGVNGIEYHAIKNANIDKADTREVYKGVTKENRELISKIMNGRKDKEGQPSWLLERVDRLRNILDRAMNEARNLKMMRKHGDKKILVGGSGKAFPQVPNADGIAFLEEAFNKGQASARVFSWAQEQVKQGHYDSIEQAIKALQNFRESIHRGLNPYFERTRVELPENMVEWDGSKILPNLYERNWLTVEGVRKWGNDFELLSPALEKIKIEFGTHEYQRVRSFIDLSFGKMSDASVEAQRISNLVRSFQFQTKAGMSPLGILRNMLDRIAKGFAISPTATIRTFIEYPPFINQFIESSQKLEDEMIRIGAIFGHGSISEGYEAGQVLTELSSSPFASSERGNQVTIALVQMHKLYNDIQALKSKKKILDHIFDKVSYIWGGGTKQIQGRLKRTAGELYSKIEKGEELTQDEIGYILHMAVKNNAFPMVMTTKPLWYDNHPVIKALAQFKTWPVRQLNMVWQDVVKYTFKTGDTSRLFGFLVGTLIAGELYNILRDFLLGKRESLLSELLSDEEEKDYAMRIMNDMFDGGLVGMLADFSYGIKDWVTGVSARTGKNLWRTGNYIIQDWRLTPQALESLLTKELVPYRQIKLQSDKLDRLFGNENNITKEYIRWRAEGWDWSEKKQNPTKWDKIKAYTDDVINGKEEYPVGEDTLAYELASRQVVVGDIEDAAKYIRYAIDNSDKPVKDSIQGIRNSMKNRSPLGKIKASDRNKFFKNYSSEERKQAIETHNKYIRNYQKAISLALSNK